MNVPASVYRERPPIAALAEHVLCVWSQAIGAGEMAHRQRVLPDGCADLVWIGEAPAVVAGPATGPVIVPLAPGTIVVGARLRPGAAALLGPPASALSDRDTPLGDIWSPAALSGPIAGQGPIEARLAAVEAALARRLADAAPPDPGIVAATRWLARHPAGRIDDLADLLDTGPRQLHRRFLAAVGYGPKTLQRVLRLQRFLALAARSRASLAELAAGAGYADQAHMSREVRVLTGQSPSVLLRGPQSTLALSDLFKTGGCQPSKKAPSDPARRRSWSSVSAW
jgi:AraC-like DNA-binding protein